MFSHVVCTCALRNSKERKVWSLKNRISLNINLTQMNVKRYQCYARVVHGSINTNAISKGIALIARSCDVTLPLMMS